MGLFGKQKKEEKTDFSKKIDISAKIPELPELPELPDFGPQKNFNIPQLPPRPNALPRYPSNSLGDKFSQNTIKDAVSGDKEDEEEADESEDEEEIQTMPKLPSKPMTKEMPSEREINPNYKVSVPKPMRGIETHEMDNKPVFVRLDKFEDSLEVFEKIKKQISGVERLLDQTKQIKEQEDKELESWEEKLETMKNQIEKIDKDIFSKLG